MSVLSRNALDGNTCSFLGSREVLLWVNAKLFQFRKCSRPIYNNNFGLRLTFLSYLLYFKQSACSTHLKEQRGAYHVQLDLNYELIPTGVGDLKTAY
jgi:hypothetical protein